MSEFNPYLEWLGVDRTRPNFYRLLGLEYYERSPSVITREAAERLEKLAPHLNGPRAELALKVQQEIEMACSVLLDSKRRAKYESLMKAQLEKAGRAATPPVSSNLDSSKSSDVTDDWLPPSAVAPSTDANPDSGIVCAEGSLASDDDLPPLACTNPSEDLPQSTSNALPESSPPPSSPPITAPIEEEEPPEAIPLAKPAASQPAPYHALPPDEPAWPAAPAQAAPVESLPVQAEPAPHAPLSQDPQSELPNSLDVDDDLPAPLSFANPTPNATAPAVASPAAPSLATTSPATTKPQPAAIRPSAAPRRQQPSLPWGTIAGVAAACVAMIFGLLFATSSGPFAPEKPASTPIAKADSPQPVGTNPPAAGKVKPPTQPAVPVTPPVPRPDVPASTPTTKPDSPRQPEPANPGMAPPTPKPETEKPPEPKPPVKPPEPPAKPPVTPEPPPAPTAAPSPAVQELLMASRVAMAKRDLELATAKLDEAKALDAQAGTAAEIERVSTLLYLVKGFWDGAEEGVKELPIGSVTIQDITVSVVEKNPEYFVLRQSGQNRRYYLRTPPSSASVGGLELAPTGLVYGLAKGWFDAKDPGTPMFLGAFLCVNPTSDRAEARTQWEMAATTRFANEVAVVMPELDVKIPMSATTPMPGDMPTSPVGDTPPALATADDGRYEVPGPSVLRQAETQMRKQFESDFAAAKMPAEKAALAEKLFQQAQSATDPLAKYVLLEEAGSLAVSGGDLNFAFIAISEIEAEYFIDGLERKTGLLERAVRTAETPDQHKLVAETALALLDEALLFNNIKFATQNARMALAAARKASDSELLMRASMREKEVRDLK